MVIQSGFHKRGRCRGKKSSASKGVVTKTARICRRVDFQRTVGDSKQEATIRPAVRRLILLRHNNQEVPFSPDGPLTWGEIDQVRTDVFTPALVGLFPANAVRVGERWTAANTAIQELTDLERIEESKIECRPLAATKAGRMTVVRATHRLAG